MMTKDAFYTYMYDHTIQELEGYWDKKNVKLEQRSYEHGKSVFLCMRTGSENLLFDLDGLYRRYLAGETKEDILCHILGLWKEDKEFFKTDFSRKLNSFEEIKERIRMRIYSDDYAKELQGDRLCEKLRFFTVLYYVVFEKEDGCRMAIPVLQSHFDRWGVKLEDVRRAAFENQKKDGIFLVPLHQASNEPWEMEKHNFFYDIPQGEEIEEVPCFCLTVKDLEFGASLIVNPKVLKKVRKILGRDFYILPTSIHETIIVPDNGNNSRKLSDMVREINAMELAEYERLCDEVLCYISEKEIICSASEYAALRYALLKKRKNDLLRSAVTGGRF